MTTKVMLHHYYKKKIILHYSQEQNLWEHSKPLPWQTAWLCQVGGKMFNLPNSILTIDGPMVCKGGTWYQGVGTKWWCCRTPYLPKVDTVCELPCAADGLVSWTLHSGLGWAGQRAYLRCRSGMLCKTSSHMWGSWYLSMFLLRDGSLIIMNMASFMVLVMVCDSLPTVEKLSSLVRCPKVLVWS